MINWFTFTIASIIFATSSFFFSKKLFNEKEHVDPRIYGACLQFITGLVSLPVAFVAGFSFDLTLKSGILLILMTITYIIGTSLYFVGLKKVDLSETTVLDSSGVIWSLILGALVLQEEITGQKMLGAALIIVAILIVAFKPSKKLLAFSKYELFIIAAPFFMTLGLTLDNWLTEFSNPITYLSVSFLLVGLTMFLVNAHRLKHVGKQTLGNKSFLKTILMNGTFLALTFFCVFSAYDLGGEVSKMYPIQQIESVLVPIGAVFLLKEKGRLPQKLIAMVIAFGGLLLMKG